MRLMTMTTMTTRTLDIFIMSTLTITAPTTLMRGTITPCGTTPPNARTW
jgi:hypothetical protein